MNENFKGLNVVGVGACARVDQRCQGTRSIPDLDTYSNAPTDRAYRSIPARASSSSRRSWSVALLAVAGLQGCIPTTPVTMDHRSEFVGKYVVTDRSSSSHFLIDSMQLDVRADGYGVMELKFGEVTEPHRVFCDIAAAHWENWITTPENGAQYNLISCKDEWGVRWHLVHANPGAKSITPLMARITMHDVSTQSGYLLRRAAPGRYPYDYALMRVDPIR